jgi:hypothetical protein
VVFSSDQRIKIAGNYGMVADYQGNDAERRFTIQRSGTAWIDKNSLIHSEFSPDLL